MTITGAHVLLYTPEPDALRRVIRDATGWRHVDAHEGWLIFALPPAELAVHPGETTKHELALMCDDVEATLTELREHGIAAREDARDLGFGLGTTIVLPGGVEVLVYEPRHASPLEGSGTSVGASGD
jgi:hypothetical protein